MALLAHWTGGICLAKGEGTGDYHAKTLIPFSLRGLIGQTGGRRFGNSYRFGTKRLDILAAFDDYPLAPLCGPGIRGSEGFLRA